MNFNDTSNNYYRFYFCCVLCRPIFCSHAIFRYISACWVMSVSTGCNCKTPAQHPVCRSGLMRVESSCRGPFFFFFFFKGTSDPRVTNSTTHPCDETHLIDNFKVMNTRLVGGLWLCHIPPRWSCVHTVMQNNDQAEHS